MSIPQDGLNDDDDDDDYSKMRIVTHLICSSCNRWLVRDLSVCLKGKKSKVSLMCFFSKGSEGGIETI